jgi:hypothetical protein
MDKFEMVRSGGFNADSVSLVTPDGGMPADPTPLLKEKRDGQT